MRIGIIGIGNIGSAILHGLLTADLEISSMESIFISDVEIEKLQPFEKNERIKVCKGNEEVAKEADIIILAVKPKEIKRTAREIAYFLNEDKILVSVAAGVTTSAIEAEIASQSEERDKNKGNKVKVIRVMPNIALQMNEAVLALCKGKNAKEEDEEEVKKLFNAIGTVYSIKEEYIDVITGLSGSGIAFFASIIDAMADGALYEGLPRELALKISAKTAAGAAKMILMGKKPLEIKEMVSSPGGTTIRGLYMMESKGVKAAMMEAVIEATKKAKGISKDIEIEYAQ